MVIVGFRVPCRDALTVAYVVTRGACDVIHHALLIAAGIAALSGLILRPAPDWRFADPPMARTGTGGGIETVFTYTSTLGVAHAPAFVLGPDGREIVWFDGIRESHNDVEILQANLSDSEVRSVLSRRSVSQLMSPRQTILTLGNTIGDVESNNYFATVVTIGGWAAASIAHVTETQARKLNLSPLIARSHLVKSPVVPMANGMLMVPAYFELSEGYGVAALLNEDRRVIDQSVMRGGFSGIQPVVVPYSELEAVALLRRFDRVNDRLLASWTADGGRSWSAPEQLAIPNPNSPVAAVLLDDGRILMLYNDAPDRANTLRFAVSSDGGRTWSPRRLLDGPDGGALRYPMMEVTDDGSILVTYSDDKQTILAHLVWADWALEE